MSVKKKSSLTVLPGEEETGLWYEAGLRFACTECGHCCSGGPGYVWLGAGDVERMAGHLHISVEAFTRQYVRHIAGQGFSLTERRDYDCIFLRREGGKARCDVYESRPMQCRTWPFWGMNLKNPDAWTQASQRCAGMCDATGRKYTLAEIEARRKDPGSPE